MNLMNKKRAGILVFSLGALLWQGCIAFPPLIQVEHKDSPANQDLMHRLDAIDHRLEALEQKADKK